MASQYLESSTKDFKILLSQFWSLISFKIIITAAMLIIGSYLLVSQQINVGLFIVADIFIITIIGSIEKLIMNLDAVYDALVSVEKLNIITEAGKEGGGSLLLEVKNGGLSLECNNISFAYGDNAPVLANFNLVIEKGEMVQLKGASGVGKSTFLRLFTGAFINYTGNILIDGIPLANYNIASLRQQTGIMLGNPDLFQGTIKENITDFREMKTEYSNKLEKIEAKLSAGNHDQIDIKVLLDKGINNLLKLEHIYETSDIEKKREIISSMYSEKMTFDGFSFRTNRIN